MPSNDLVVLAKTLSKTFHRNQKYGLEDYFKYHIKGVVKSLKLHNYTDNYIIVAYLHDIVEDTSVSLETVRNLFGPVIATAVASLTKRENEPREMYITRCASNPIARVVKLHDAMFNANNCLKNKNKQKYNEYISNTISKLLM